ncbi:MAG: LURP-one-related/scramblase family protein [Cellulosilyticaceae bacterium]
MRLYIKQRVFSFNDSFVVKDEAGQDRYYVEGEMFSFGHKLHVMDASRREVAFIKQRVMTFMPKFEITVEGKVVGELIKRMTFFRPSYFIEGSNLSLEGDFFDHDYTLERGGRPVMHIYKEWFTWGDSYVLDIADPADELISLAIVLAIDCEMCSRNNN